MGKMNYRVGIIGCGLMGHKRAAALESFSSSKLVKVCDTNPDKAKELAAKYSCEFTADSREVTRDKNIDLVIVSVVNSALAGLTIDSLKNSKHVLVEKPAAVSPDELAKVIKAYESLGRKFKIKVGFNHRFHPAVCKAKEIISTGNLGEVMFIRARYGHGGRPGYDKEWRAHRKTAGGGELLDQGSHLIDLSRYFMAEVEEAAGYFGSFFWDMEVEDNCFLLLKTKKGQIAQLHASWSQWKNAFAMEIFCRNAQIDINGLGGSYGRETLTFYRMKPEMGVPDKFVYGWDKDTSWLGEYTDFINSIEGNHEPNGSIYDAYESLKLVYKIYEGGKNGNIFGHGQY